MLELPKGQRGWVVKKGGDINMFKLKNKDYSRRVSIRISVVDQ